MVIRTLHCGKNVNNYNLCIDKQVAGFTHRGPQSGEQIYLLIKQGKKTVCGARFLLKDVTDEKPWEDADKYVCCYSVKDIEFCQFFELDFLKNIGGEFWSLKYLQGSKIFDEKASEAISIEFNKNKIEKRLLLELETLTENSDVDDEDIIIYTPEQESQIEREVPDEKINIMGTFQTIPFENESDTFKGLEKLVTQNFFSLFSAYTEDNSILIAKNRLFRTQQRDDPITGISAIPDALLLNFKADDKECPIHISLIEYECYGKRKVKPFEKSRYMNSHIIPQLMQFASSFSIITDQKTRINTINDWIEKIIEETNSEEIADKIDKWLKELNPNIKTREIISVFEKELRKSFQKALKVMLIIDELSTEQKETIRNIISSFKLESESDIEFESYIVRLVQKINLITENFEYGLTVQ